MSNTDGFIEEVTEEVRRDKLFQTLKKWGWVGGLAVLLIVGGAAFNEYRKSRNAASAQAFGDGLLSGLQADDDGAALAALTPDDPAQQAIARHMAGAVALEGDASDRALSEFEVASQLIDAPQIYRDLAQFKLALALPPDRPAEERIAAFEAMTEPGAAFRLLSLEQIALIRIEAGETDAAISQLLSLIDEAGVTPGLQRRASELIVALGGELPES